MSELKRITRILKSWTGKVKREVYYNVDDARMILNDLGMQMSPAALAYMTSSDVMMEGFLGRIYAAEDETGKFLIEDGMRIDPTYFPKVYEMDGNISFSLNFMEKEVIFAEFPWEGATKKSQPVQHNELPSEEKDDGKTINIEIE